MKISVIAAMAKNGVIGRHNQLPWHLPADLQHFKQLTLGKPVIMGRQTYLSIGKPLPKRRNIVISRQADLEIDGCEVVHSLSAALKSTQGSEEVFIIGGEQIFRAAVAHVNQVYLTVIQQEFEGDCFLPTAYRTGFWWKTVSRTDHAADERNLYAYRFLTLRPRYEWLQIHPLLARIAHKLTDFLGNWLSKTLY